jgi:hypothetical protein
LFWDCKKITWRRRMVRVWSGGAKAIPRLI